MTERLHRLIDSGAAQPVVNERIATLLEEHTSSLSRIGSDHEKRLRYLERMINYSLGAIGLIAALIEGVRVAHEFIK